MSDFDTHRVPRFLAGYRFQWEPAQQAYVLLYPEGMIQLNESAGTIASLIDGQRSVAAIISELEVRYPGVAELADDVVQFMEVAHGKFWLQLV